MALAGQDRLSFASNLDQSPSFGSPYTPLTTLARSTLFTALDSCGGGEQAFNGQCGGGLLARGGDGSFLGERSMRAPL